MEKEGFLGVVTFVFFLAMMGYHRGAFSKEVELSDFILSDALAAAKGTHKNRSSET